VSNILNRLVLMTYHGVVLLLSGYQADEAHIIKQYTAIVDSVEARYPNGSLWILNRVCVNLLSSYFVCHHGLLYGTSPLSSKALFRTSFHSHLILSYIVFYMHSLARVAIIVYSSLWLLWLGFRHISPIASVTICVVRRASLLS